MADVPGSSDSSAGGISRRALLTGGAGVAGAAALASSGLSSRAAAATPSGTHWTVDLAGSTSALPHFWEECIGGDHAKQALRRDFQDQLQTAHRELGVKRVRMHGILDPQMSVYVANRTPGFTTGPYSFFNIDQIYDHLVGIGVRPYVEVGFMPPDLAADPTKNDGFYYGYNAGPPADYQAWADLVTAFVKQVVDRYGIHEVAQWPFEVWNEPNLDFWGGTPAEYDKLYQYTANAIKDVDASLQVGGPATDGDGLAFVEQFLDFVSSNHLPLDFVSSHAYENNALSSTNGVADVFAPTRKVIPKSVPYFISETGCNYSNVSDELDTSYAAAFLVKAIDRCDGIVDLLSLWCFSDIFEEGSQASNLFFGGFGATTMYGIRKPMYRVFELLHQAGTRRVPVGGLDSGDTAGALAIRQDHGALDVFCYNHALPTGPVPSTETVTVTVSGASRNARATITRIDADSVNPRRTWQEQGSPAYPTRHQLDAISEASQTHTSRITPVHSSTSHGRTDLTFQVTLPPEGVAVLHLA